MEAINKPLDGVDKPFDLVGSIIEFEQWELDNNAVVSLFSHLVKTWQAWTLQGSYGRFARCLIDSWYLTAEGEILVLPDGSNS